MAMKTLKHSSSFRNGSLRESSRGAAAQVDEVTFWILDKIPRETIADSRDWCRWCSNKTDALGSSKWRINNSPYDLPKEEWRRRKNGDPTDQR